MKSRIALAAAASIAGLAMVLAGCSSSGGSSSSSAAGTTITVGAASSLTNVFTQIGDAFMKENPDVTVQFSFAGSSAIAEQIKQGAPIDVFASAGTNSMQPVVDAALVDSPVDFAKNSLAIATPPGNPAGVTGLADLPNVTVLVCQEQVPCGVAARKLFEANGLTITPVSLEPDVRAVLTKIEADEADAGIVYVTDIKEAGDKVAGVEIPAADNVTTTYQAAAVKASSSADAAAKFVAFLASPTAQALLAQAAFAAP